jgi:hypothetical protein
MINSHHAEKSSARPGRAVAILLSLSFWFYDALSVMAISM